MHLLFHQITERVHDGAVAGEQGHALESGGDDDHLKVGLGGFAACHTGVAGVLMGLVNDVELRMD